MNSVDPVHGTDFKELVKILEKLEADKKDFVCAGPAGVIPLSE
jgi:hypothetical protein